LKFNFCPEGVSDFCPEGILPRGVLPKGVLPKGGFIFDTLPIW